MIFCHQFVLFPYYSFFSLHTCVLGKFIFMWIYIVLSFSLALLQVIESGMFILVNFVNIFNLSHNFIHVIVFFTVTDILHRLSHTTVKCTVPCVKCRSVGHVCTTYGASVCSFTTWFHGNSIRHRQNSKKHWLNPRYPLLSVIDLLGPLAEGSVCWWPPLPTSYDLCF